MKLTRRLSQPWPRRSPSSSRRRLGVVITATTDGGTAHDQIEFTLDDEVTHELQRLVTHTTGP